MAIITNPITTDRVKKVEIRPYDQVFALTQSVINQGLAERWAVLKRENKDLGDTFDAGTPGAGFMSKLVLDAPRIMVETGMGKNLSSCIYMVCFKSGSYLVRALP